jgi:hypothetical protein
VFEMMQSLNTLSLLSEARRPAVDKVLQTKLFNFVRFSVPSPSVQMDWSHCKKVLSWPLWPADLRQACDLASSVLLELFPFSLAFRVLHSLTAAMLLAKDGKHELQLTQIRSGQLRACLAMKELGGGCDASAVLLGNHFVLSSPPKLLVTRDCDVAIFSARLDGALLFFAVQLRDSSGQLLPGVRIGALGESEFSCWVRLYDVQIGRDALLQKSSLEIVDQLVARASAGFLVVFLFCFFWLLSLLSMVCLFFLKKKSCSGSCCEILHALCN